MPPVVYGLVDAKISHRIETPAPAQNERDARPDACTLCHVDRTRAWASGAMEAWKIGGAPPNTSGDVANSEAARMLFAGDPLERALAAAALGRQGVAASQAERFELLLDVLARERYPAVRDIARRSLLQLESDNPKARALLERFVATELDPSVRQAQASAIASALEPPATTQLLPATIDALRSTARDRDIEIGE
jgi:hypothetical protein